MNEVTRIDKTRARLDRESADSKSKWRDRLARHKNGNIIADERNVLLAFRHAPELTGLLRFNEFAMRAEFTRAPPWRAIEPEAAWTDDDDVDALGWLQSQGFNMRGRDRLAACVSVVAKDATYHPVRDYLSALKWDGEQRLNMWLADYLEATGDPPYLAAVGRRFLISAVARAFRPGCQVDHVLVLESPQGTGKSSAGRALAASDAWFTDEMPDLHSKDASLQLNGRWLIELSELSAVRRSEIEAVKSFLTRRIDVFRPPYGRRTSSFPRQCVFFASTNQQQYLRDRTGNRRFWPVACGKQDLVALARDRDQLWAEAVHAYESLEQWHLTREEEALARAEQEERVPRTELEVAVAEHLASLEERGIRETDTRSVMIDALSFEPDKPDFIERAGRIGAELAAVMAAAGWQRVGPKGRGKTRRNIYRKPR